MEQSRQDRLDSLVVNVERAIRAECFLYIFEVPGVPLGQRSAPACAIPACRKVKKKAPHRRKEELPLVVVPTHAGNAGPSSYRSVVRINYMDDSLGKVKKAQRTRAVIMNSNSQQLTVDRLFCEPSMRTCDT